MYLLNAFDDWFKLVVTLSLSVLTAIFQVNLS